MKKQTKADRIRTLVLSGFKDRAIANMVKCDVSYAWRIRSKMARVSPMVKPKNKKAVDALLQRQIDAAKDTGVPTRTGEGTGWVDKKSILDDAKDIIYGDREKTYGAPDKNLVAIAGYWANHLNTRFGVYHDITGADVCIMMTLLKAARLGNDVTHRDSLVDAVGYLALLERIQK
jgi:hypothetical protein